MTADGATAVLTQMAEVDNARTPPNNIKYVLEFEYINSPMINKFTRRIILTDFQDDCKNIERLA